MDGIWGEMKGHQQRASIRRPLATDALCRTAGGRIPVTIDNLSCHGCRIASQEPLDSGQHLEIKIGGFEELRGHVRWVIGSRAGVTFEQPLQGPLFDDLMRLHGIVGHMMVDR